MIARLLFLSIALFVVGCASQQSTTVSAEELTKRAQSPDDDSDDLETKDETPDVVIEDTSISEQRSRAEVEADIMAQKTFPLVYNEFVEQWIKYFTSVRGRPVMQKWLSRSTRYMPLMQQALREGNLPEDLVYLAMIESGFNLKAKSHAKAVGPWQFIASTGRRYGLESTYWVDERRDIRKSTLAAAAYLKELHQVFGSWYLAAAAYNAGEGKVLNAVRRDRTRNFWELARKKANFRAETRNYVPKIIAAALIGKNPEKYGFTDVAYQQPLAWDIVRVPSGVTMQSIAQNIEMDPDDLHIMNAELRRGITPPGPNGYELRVPPQLKDKLVTNLGKLESKKIGNFLEHVIRRGDNLGSIARRYGVDTETLIDLNKIRNTRALRIGQEILIPVAAAGSDDTPRRKKRPDPKDEKQEVAKKQAPFVPRASLGADQYQVAQGDSLWSIAQKLGTSVEELKRLNRIRSARSLQVGQVLTVPRAVEKSTEKTQPKPDPALGGR